MKYFKFNNYSDKDKIQHSLYLFGSRIYAFYYSNRFGWFRLFSIGLKWKDVSIYGLTFSERNGYSRYLKIGKYVIGYLFKNWKE